MNVTEKQADKRLSPKEVLSKLFGRLDACISAGFAFLTAIFVAFAFHRKKECAEDIILCLAFFWSIVPPVWFLYDWCAENSTGEDLENFKYRQEVSRNIWLGIVGLLIFLGEYFKNSP